MSGSPVISFVVPCYNYGRYLGDCLESIFRQVGNYDFEIVAIDDCSTDDTPQVLRRFADPRLRVFTHEGNQGHVVTINEGFQAARGRFIARIDPDDRYRPHFLGSTVKRLEAYPEVGMVYGDAALINENGAQTAPRSDRVHGGQDYKGNELVALLEENFICAPTTIARKEAWDRALPIPQGLAFSDWYLSLMIARHYDFYYVDEVVADYRVHGTNHHTMIVADRREEPSLFRVMDLIYQAPEPNHEVEQRKQAARKRAYAVQYLRLAEKYFGLQMNADARRCYLKALAHRPTTMMKAGPLRRLLATCVGRNHYERCKRMVRSARSRLGLGSP